MFFLGFDTVSTCLTLAVYHLALNPDIQEKLYNETMATLRQISTERKEKSNESDQNDDPYKLVTYDNLSRFEYIAAVIDEALRIESPAMYMERRVSQNMELSNSDGSIKFNVKKGDMLHFPLYSIHRDSRYFYDPERFIPERFLNEPEYHKYAYLPFGLGPRKCIAKGMALLEARLALLHVILNFRFEAISQTKVYIFRILLLLLILIILF